MRDIIPDKLCAGFTMNKVLNVGGNNKSISLPSCYAGWEHILLDIDARGNPDIILDARKLLELPAAKYDAVYCSHNLEHYYRHDASRVLMGFLHLLKDDGFAHIVVPDIGELMRTVVKKEMDIDDFLYLSPMGPITVRDVLYGYGQEIEGSGNDFYAHKTGYTQKALTVLLKSCGFSYAYVGTGNLEILAFAFKNKPSAAAIKLLKLPVSPSA
jgi:hypothetical protein